MATDDLRTRVQARIDSLTKPRGSLGRLEDIALGMAMIQQREIPSVDRKGLYVFCADHGIVAEGVSAYPQSVTGEMMKNFVAGGAAIAVLCRRLNIHPVIVDAGAAGPTPEGVLNRKIAAGTRNFLHQPAMTREQAHGALELGRAMAREAALRFDVVGLGEMGIGNTSSASALLSAFTGMDPKGTSGPGTGLDPRGVSRKASIIREALAIHRPNPSDPIGVLAMVGGFEIGAIAGFLLEAAHCKLAVVLDGFPCCSAGLVARAIDRDALKTAFFAHCAAEPGHVRMLESLDAKPLLQLGMRLGEGSGAALAIGLVETAVLLYREMATFSEAGVSRATKDLGTTS